MATLIERGTRERLTTPFFSRAYGAFTRDQQAFYRSFVSGRREKVFDSLAGQAFALAELSWEGHPVWVADINPAPLLLASLRDPRLLHRHKEATQAANELVSRFREHAGSGRAEYEDEWLSQIVKSELREYATFLTSEDNPLAYGLPLWETNPIDRLLAALPVLAARLLTSFRTTDNAAWVKRGGLRRHHHIFEPLEVALRLWSTYAEAVVKGGNIDPEGALFILRLDATKDLSGQLPKVDVLISSPPYANRLDYTQMWAPELRVIEAMWQGDAEIKSGQIGSTTVRGLQVVDLEKEDLPAFVHEALQRIREDDAKASGSYYYPFFLNYAVQLRRALLRSIECIKRRGVIVVFVRDTVRKDVLFPTGEFVRHLMTQVGLDEQRIERIVVRRHIGLRRKSSKAGVYGLAQSEWWLAFRRS